MPEPTEIAIAVVEHESKFLVGLRPAGIALAGFWEFPGGKVEANETAQAAAARECLEETGVAINVGQEYQVTDHQYDHGKVRLHFFACSPVEKTSLEKIALADPRFQWISREELRQLKFPAANQALLELLGSSLD